MNDCATVLLPAVSKAQTEAVLDVGSTPVMLEYMQLVLEKVIAAVINTVVACWGPRGTEWGKRCAAVSSLEAVHRRAVGAVQRKESATGLDVA